MQQCWEVLTQNGSMVMMAVSNQQGFPIVSLQTILPELYWLLSLTTYTDVKSAHSCVLLITYLCPLADQCRAALFSPQFQTLSVFLFHLSFHWWICGRHPRLATLYKIHHQSGAFLRTPTLIHLLQNGGRKRKTTIKIASDSHLKYLVQLFLQLWLELCHLFSPHTTPTSDNIAHLLQ